MVVNPRCFRKRLVFLHEMIIFKFSVCHGVDLVSVIKYFNHVCGKIFVPKFWPGRSQIDLAVEMRRPA